MKKRWNRIGTACLMALSVQGCGEVGVESSQGVTPTEHVEAALKTTHPVGLARVALSPDRFKHTEVIAKSDALSFRLNGTYRLPTQAIHLNLVGNNGVNLRHTEDKANQMTVVLPKEDGLYNWRLVRQPQLDEDAVAPLKKARAEGNLERIEKLTRKLRAEGVLPSAKEVEQNVSSGSFRINNGQIVDPSLEENTAKASLTQTKGQ